MACTGTRSHACVVRQVCMHIACGTQGMHAHRVRHAGHACTSHAARRACMHITCGMQGMHAHRMRHAWHAASSSGHVVHTHATQPSVPPTPRPSVWSPTGLPTAAFSLPTVGAHCVTTYSRSGPVGSFASSPPTVTLPKMGP
eukprot:366553-Chlamydomonas_euryale.AAC.6